MLGAANNSKRYLVVATGGAGGDLQPLAAAALELRRRGHEISFLADEAVGRALAGQELAVEVLPHELDLGPRLASSVGEAMAATGGDLAAAGIIVEERLAAWAAETAVPVVRSAARVRPDAIVTSLFGVEVLKNATPQCPWAVVNSTFFIGPNPPRPIEQDVSARAVPLLARYARLLAAADLVLHATDQVFDFSFRLLPPRHHYVGPLGIWEPPADPPRYLDEPGDPWVLVSISSQLQDDLPLAKHALTALADQPVRVLVTVGLGHGRDALTVQPPNAHIEQLVPHSAVLKRSVMFVSHAGHGSVMKALWEGTPMVLVPWGRDQPGVAARAAALGVAEVVRRDGDIDVALPAAIDHVLADRSMHDRAAEHARRLRASDPPGAAATLLEGLV